ncbi:hypothetical protein RB195_020508 [Necator americanus]|uniref:C-type lectin domain-containing protein n=1 Tax=Necator americanus TaxID=51031 RepID=A0ABR1CJ68_NECAM
MLSFDTLFYAFLVFHATNAFPLRDEKTQGCSNGWHKYHDSCYFMDNPLMDFEKAQIKCWDFGGTLLLAENLEEYRFATEYSKPNTWSWVGITLDEHFHHPQWVNSGGINATAVNWLVKPFNPFANGWSTKAKCAAHLNSRVASASFMFFFPCNVQLFSICEKNLTLHRLVNP